MPYTQKIVAHNIRVRSNLANLSKHLVEDGLLECKPFEDDEELLVDSGLSNAYVSAIYCVSSSVSLPYDVCVTCFDTQLILQSGDMQRTPTSLIPLYRNDQDITVYLKSVCPNPDEIDAYLIGKHLCLPHTHVNITVAEALGFCRENVMEHVYEHKRKPGLLIISNACVWLPLLYKCAAYFVQTKKQPVQVLTQRTPNFWYVQDEVFNKCCEFAEQLCGKNKLLNASTMSFKLERADGTLWYEKMRCVYIYCFVNSYARQ